MMNSTLAPINIMMSKLNLFRYSRYFFPEDHEFEYSIPIPSRREGDGMMVLIMDQYATSPTLFVKSCWNTDLWIINCSFFVILSLQRNWKLDSPNWEWVMDSFPPRRIDLSDRSDTVWSTLKTFYGNRVSTLEIEPWKQINCLAVLTVLVTHSSLGASIENSFFENSPSEEGLAGNTWWSLKWR